jgi:uncharacterized membrane protein YfcA
MIFYSVIQPIYFLLPIVGFSIGMLGSMLGGGGGFFFLPMLTLVLNVPAQTAVATSLVATLPICIAGTVSHYYKRNVNLQIAALFALSGIVGSFVGTGIVNLMDTYQLRLAFGIYSVLMATQIAVKTWKEKMYHEAEKVPSRSLGSLGVLKGSFFGLIAGVITGAFGTSGTAPVLAGLFSMRLPLKVVIGTSLFIVLINTATATGAHFMIGKIDLTLIGFLTIGSVFGALIGPRVLSAFNVTRKESRLKYGYALGMLAVGILMIFNSLNI